jgi:hypothetical protein
MSSAPRIDLEVVRRWGAELVNHLFTIAGGIVSVVTLIVMLESKGSRHWVKDNPFLLLTLLVAAVAVILLMVNAMQRFNARYRSLSALLPAGDPLPSEHDRQLTREALAELPPGGPLIRWLRQEFVSSAAPQDRVQEFAAAARHLSHDPLDFDDKEMAIDYLRLKTSAGKFSQKLQLWMSLEAGETQRIIPVEWSFDENGKYRLAVTEIEDAHNDLLRAYDRFLHTCQHRGLGTS